MGVRTLSATHTCEGINWWIFSVNRPVTSKQMGAMLKERVRRVAKAEGASSLFSLGVEREPLDSEDAP